MSEFRVNLECFQSFSQPIQTVVTPERFATKNKHWNTEDFIFPQLDHIDIGGQYSFLIEHRLLTNHRRLVKKTENKADKRNKGKRSCSLLIDLETLNVDDVPLLFVFLLSSV